MKQRLLVSACLLGKPTRYDGKSVLAIDAELLARLTEKYELIPVCPEVAGGLPTPRVPSERQGERVVMKDGRDVTEEFYLGAMRSLNCAYEEGARTALLKERSPSCGKSEIYDGSFEGRKIKGQGVLAQMLIENGIEVYSEDDILDLLK